MHSTVPAPQPAPFARLPGDTSASSQRSPWWLAAEARSNAPTRTLCKGVRMTRCGGVWINASTSRRHHQLCPGAEQSAYDHICPHWVHLRLYLSSHTHLPHSVSTTRYMTAAEPSAVSHIFAEQHLCPPTLFTFVWYSPLTRLCSTLHSEHLGYQGRQKAPKNMSTSWFHR